MLKELKDKKSIHPIAHIYTDFPSKFGVPRQSSLKKELFGVIVFEPEYAREEAFRELEGFSHLWVIWHFSESEGGNFSLTVRPPRLGGNKRVGVFASRAPFRPNELGLSCVKLEKICSNHEACGLLHCPLGKKACRAERGTSLLVSGIDMKNGTPVFDVKPYVPITDCHPEALEGYTAFTKKHLLKVSFPDNIYSFFSPEKLPALKAALEEDPRPGYKHNPENPDKIYRMEFDDLDIPFRVHEDTLIVLPTIKQTKL